MWRGDESFVSVRCPRAMTRVLGRFSTSDVDPMTFESSMNCERHQEKTPNSLTPHRSKSTPTTPYVITVGIDNNFPLPPSPLVTQKPFPPEANQDNCRLLLCPAVSSSRSSDKPPQSSQHHGSEQPASEWIDPQDDPLNNRTPSPMFSKDSPSSSNRSSTSSSNSSGYLGSSNQVNHPSPSGGRQSRLSGQSCESGVSSISSSRYSYLSGSSSSQSSLDRLEGTATHSNTVHVHELFQQGLKEAEVLHAWLSDLRLAECYPLFVHAGYDMPTISRMTPEDLTAIGITQPAVRKRLTSEISKLHICDGIPNHKPNSLLEWLQCLHLDEYYKVLARDGYEDLDRVTDIIWEDLEEIGIHKLGHQKKIMLAIDRLKKLNVSTRRLSSFDPSVSTDHPASARSSVIKTSTSPSHVNPHILEQATRRIRRSFSGENMSSLVRENDPVDMSRILHLRPQVSSTPQPELVVIQVNNASRSWTSSVSDDTEGSTPIKYESFHGNPFQDFHCLRKETDGGDTTPTNDKGAASSDEMESSAACVRFRPQLAPKPKLTCRMRRASGGSAIYGETEVSLDPLLWNGSFHGFSERGVNGLVTAPKSSPEFTRPTSATVCYHSVPNTPAHSSSRGGGSRKTAPPPPPKRTNSVKGGMSPRAESDYVNAVEFSKPLSPLLRSKAGSTSAELAISRALSGSEPKSEAPIISPVLSPCSSPQKPHAEMKATDDPSILSLAKQRDQPTDASPLKRKALPQSAATSSGNDCNTLPFANENVGTIKQRVANKPLAALPNKPTIRIDLKNSSKASSGCTEKTLPPSKTDTGSPSKKPVRPVPKQKPKIVRTDLKNPDSAGGVKVDNEEKEGDVFNDIDDLFQGLSQELDQMLTFHG